MKIAALIVTYNRKELLTRCIRCVEAQTRLPDKLIILDNNSTDGTDILLHSLQFALPTEIVRMKENTGGAGGFNKGMITALEDPTIDAVWMMDDDGSPDSNCLENLIKHWDESQYLAPLVVSDTDHSRLAFGKDNNRSVNDLLAIHGSDGVILGRANPFNGILVKREATDKAGFPNPLLFIWGDEVEYQTRLKSFGILPVTVLNAIHYHPEDKMEMTYDIFGRKAIIYVNSPKKRYCKYRNMNYTNWHYGNKSGAIKSLFLYTSHFLITRRLDLKGLRDYLRAWFDGVRGHLTNHPNYPF